VSPNAAPTDQRVAQLLALNKAALAITGELELDTLFQQIVDSARQLVGCHYAALGILGPDGYIAHFPTSGISEVDKERIGAPPRGHGLLGVMLRAGRTLRIPNINTDPRRVGFPPHHPPMTSLIGVPIFVREQLVGDLYLTDKIDAREFDEDDEWLVQLLATHVARAMLNAELHGQVRQAQAQAESLYVEAQRGREAAEREQQRMHEVEQMKDEFLSTAAHELRTPLTTIRMTSGLLREQMEMLLNAQAAGTPIALSPRLRDLLLLLDEGSARMQALVNDLLDLTRLEQGRVPLVMADLDLREVVNDSVKATLPLFSGKSQPFALHLPESTIPVRGDRRWIEQILINLLANASKYSPPATGVEVRGECAGGECRIAVEDHGPGVPDGEREQVFEPFYRGSLHRDDPAGGTGLGLSIARTIAEKHGGRLWTEPVTGGGSRFIRALPDACGVKR
jgi:signal transduction histidine kinase